MEPVMESVATPVATPARYVPGVSEGKGAR